MTTLLKKLNKKEENQRELTHIGGLIWIFSDV